LIVSGKSNECRRASATSNSFCACGLHEVLNSTDPSLSFLVFGSSPWASTPVAAKANSEATITAMRFGVMARPPLKVRKVYAVGRLLRQDKFTRPAASKILANC